MKIEIYKKDSLSENWIMCAEVYSMKALKDYYKKNMNSVEVWELKYEIIN